MQVGRYDWSLLDPALFWRKLVMLVVFFGLFVPIYMYKSWLTVWYAVFLLALHVYVLFVFLWRVKWRVLAENRKPFIVRLVAIATFVALLTFIRAGATLAELVTFVWLSGLVHVALLLSLTVDARPIVGQPLDQEG
ncbi:MAG TPA: hypothetical protein VI818_07235 [Candidatus Thermoplasmatota archaeon]|nr:hypothetical protein [Candidatus Thermoplasmatota archaeon]